MTSAPLLTRLFYISEIVLPLSGTDMRVILGASQVKNRRADITGMLIQTSTHFLQVLEGRSDAVRKLMGAIARDRRHRSVEQVIEDDVSTRLFPRWSMELALCPEMSPELATLHRTGTLCVDAAQSLMLRASARPAGELAWR